jgi:SAM-dependent methyltransferase
VSGPLSVKLSSHERVETILRHTRGPDVLHLGASGQAEYRPAFTSPDWLHGRLHQRVEGLWGLELEARNVRALKDAGFENTIQGDAQAFEIDRRFDTVIAGELIEHVERPGALLAHAAAHLKPGGRIIITTPYAFCGLFVAYAWLKYPVTCSNRQHVSWFCPTTFTELADRSGLTVERFELIESYPSKSSSRAYRIFLRVFRLVRRLIPRRVRANTMVFVLQRPPQGT